MDKDTRKILQELKEDLRGYGLPAAERLESLEIAVLILVQDTLDRLAREECME